MKKHLLLAIFFTILICRPSFGDEIATLEGIRTGVTSEQIRIVLDIDGPAQFSYSSREGELNLYLLNVIPSENISASTDINDWILKKIETSLLDQGLLIKIPMPYPLSYKVYSLSHPSRIVIDFEKKFTQIKKFAPIANGAEYYGVIKSNGDTYVTAQVLELDLMKVKIFPALAKPPSSLVESVVQFFTPWAKKKRPGFFKQKVSEMVSQNGALAGINGTYFDNGGQPLGILMVDGRLVSYPISDRTALVITNNNKPYIDNIMLDAYMAIDGVKYSITGINEPRDSQDDIVLYTSDYGELTNTNQTGFDLVVENGKISSTRSGNTWIPENGFVVSAGSLYAENLSSSVRVGEDLSVVIGVIPYSTSINGDLKHLIGGGPRLLKSGRIYISKYEENFRRDIARGRAARTAVGIKKNDKLMFVTVDGRGRGKNKKNGRSIGMTLTELAYFMQSLGAEDALNLDGGGSSTMVISGKVMNRPVDGNERRVNNSILIKP